MSLGCSQYIATFHTHAGALKFERKLRAVSESGCRLMPVPRKISSSCGVCASYSYDDYQSLISDDVDRIFIIVDGAYSEIWRNANE